jgi:hypothetical protein
MKQSPFKMTFIFGLIIFLVPIFLVSLILLFNFVEKSKSNKDIQPKQEIIFEPDNIIDHDTVYIERPKVKPKQVTKQVTKPAPDTVTPNIVISDSETIIDTLNLKK